MTFYQGQWLIQQDSINLKHDSDSWELPDDTAQHMAETSNPEELLIKPSNMDVLPTQVQFGLAEWSEADESTLDNEAFREFYVRDEKFYTRPFQPTDYWTPAWYPSGSFYLRSFSPTDYWTPMWYPSGSFYVQPFVGINFWTDSFYIPEPSWYVRSWVPTGSLWNFYLQETGYD